jgi:hypothetical protein
MEVHGIRAWIAASVLAVLAGQADPAWALETSKGGSGIEIGAPVGRVSMEIGITHSSGSLEQGGDTQAVQAGTSALHKLFKYQNVWINEQGSGETEPQPGQFDFSKLDARLQLVRSTGGVPVITLCNAPLWMRIPGRDGASIDPSHYADFVELVRRVALRYPDVRYYLVWAELKGFDMRLTGGRAGLEYTKLYNLIYDALKRISPGIKVGGPYVHVAVDSAVAGGDSEFSGPYGAADPASLAAIRYWLKFKHGADFIAVDGTVYHNSKSAVVYPSDWFAAQRYFHDVDDWLKREAPALPIWWAEWYAVPLNRSPDLSQFNHERQNALETLALFQMMPDVAVSLRWKPEGIASWPYDGDQESVWRDTRYPGGGKLFPFGMSVSEFDRCFPVGEPLYATHTGRADIAAFASARCVAVINESASSIDALAVEKKAVNLPPYGVVFVDRGVIALHQ